MDPRQREKLLAQIPTSNLRTEAFAVLGPDKSVDLMMKHHQQLEQIQTEANTRVSTRRVYGISTAIGLLVSAGITVPLALIITDNTAASLHAEEFKQVITFIGAGVFAGGFFGLVLGGPVADLVRSEFIYPRKKLVQEQHRELLKGQLADDQVAVLYLQIAAEE